MNRIRTAATVTATVTTGLVASALGLGLLAGPAAADGPEKNATGTVAGARYDMSAEKEGNFEISADIDGVPAGSTWRMVLRHEGTVVGSQKLTARADDDGGHEVDFRDFLRPDTAGKDTFTITLRRTDGTAKVTRTLAFAS